MAKGAPSPSQGRQWGTVLPLLANQAFPKDPCNLLIRRSPLEPRPPEPWGPNRKLWRIWRITGAARVGTCFEQALWHRSVSILNSVKSLEGGNPSTLVRRGLKPGNQVACSHRPPQAKTHWLSALPHFPQPVQPGRGYLTRQSSPGRGIAAIILGPFPLPLTPVREWDWINSSSVGGAFLWESWHPQAGICGQNTDNTERSPQEEGQLWYPACLFCLLTLENQGSPHEGDPLQCSKSTLSRGKHTTYLNRSLTPLFMTDTFQKESPETSYNSVSASIRPVPLWYRAPREKKQPDIFVLCSLPWW